MAESERPTEPAGPYGGGGQHHGDQTWNPGAGYPGEPQSPPVSWPSGPRLPAQEPSHPVPDKSVDIALVLTFFFGCFGLFYSSVVGGLVMTALFFVSLIVAILTLGFGLFLTFLIWPISMLWGGITANRKHRDFETWRAHSSGVR